MSMSKRNPQYRKTRRHGRRRGNGRAAIPCRSDRSKDAPPGSPRCSSFWRSLPAPPRARRIPESCIRRFPFAPSISGRWPQGSAPYAAHPCRWSRVCSPARCTPPSSRCCPCCRCRNPACPPPFTGSCCSRRFPPRFWDPSSGRRGRKSPYTAGDADRFSRKRKNDLLLTFCGGYATLFV